MVRVRVLGYQDGAALREVRRCSGAAVARWGATSGRGWSAGGARGGTLSKTDGEEAAVER
jgi:hypothetical protein